MKLEPSYTHTRASPLHHDTYQPFTDATQQQSYCKKTLLPGAHYLKKDSLTFDPKVAGSELHCKKYVGNFAFSLKCYIPLDILDILYPPGYFASPQDIWIPKEIFVSPWKFCIPLEIAYPPGNCVSPWMFCIPLHPQDIYIPQDFCISQEILYPPIIP